MMTVLDRLKDQGVTFPTPNAPVANYVPFVMSGTMLFISGQVSNGPDGLVKGRLGEDMTLEQRLASRSTVRHQPHFTDERRAW